MRKQIWMMALVGVLAAACSDDGDTARDTGTGNKDSSKDSSKDSNPVQDTGQPAKKTIGAAGGTLASAGGEVRLEVPAGALTGDVSFTITDLPSPPAADSSLVAFGAAYDVGPDGTTFVKPAKLTIGYDPKKIPSGYADKDIVLISHDGTKWSEAQNIQVDTTAHTVSGGVSHLSPKRYAVKAMMSCVKESSACTPSGTKCCKGFFCRDISKGSFFCSCIAGGKTCTTGNDQCCATLSCGKIGGKDACCVADGDPCKQGGDPCCGAASCNASNKCEIPTP